jgi:small subunit ribosomal protein S19
MSRSSWKLPYVESSIIKKISSLRVVKKGSSFSLKTWSRSSTICSDFVNLRFRIHNGKEFIPLVISPEMIGHRLGEFVPTRVRYEFKKKKKKK